MNKNEIKIQETGLLNDERITRFMQGQMNVDEESAYPGHHQPDRTEGSRLQRFLRR